MLNYKHLYYFREVATSGSISRASNTLHLAPQTISEQLTQLADFLGTELFQKNGRNLELTEAGQTALHYADQIFQLGDDLVETMQHYPKGGIRPFRVGVSDVVPKAIAYRLLEPAMNLHPPVRIVCSEGKLDDLLGELALHRLELVIADSPLPSTIKVRGFSHKLGASSISFFANTSIRAMLQGEFPHCLNHAPILLPSNDTAVRSELKQWFAEQNVQPRVVGEFDDSALMKAFGVAGAGVFVAPSVQEELLLDEPGIILLGRAENVTEQFYAISVERRITLPAVKAITDHAQEWLLTNKGRKG